MKQKTRWHDALVLAAVLCTAFLIVTGTQQVTGRIDGVASMVFVLAVFLISIYTDGYVWGVVASLIGVLAVNFAFRSPYFAFNFTLPENLFSGMAMLVVSIMTSTLTTRIKKQEQLRMESETEKMRATLLRAVSHDLRTPLTSIYGACSTVIENYDSLEKEQKLKLLGEACSDAQWLNRMVENLLSVTRFDGVLKLLLSNNTYSLNNNQKAFSINRECLFCYKYNMSMPVGKVRKSKDLCLRSCSLRTRPRCHSMCK